MDSLRPGYGRLPAQRRWNSGARCPRRPQHGDDGFERIGEREGVKRRNLVLVADSESGQEGRIGCRGRSEEIRKIARLAGCSSARFLLVPRTCRQGVGGSSPSSPTKHGEPLVQGLSASQVRARAWPWACGSLSEHRSRRPRPGGIGLRAIHPPPDTRSCPARGPWEARQGPSIIGGPGR